MATGQPVALPGPDMESTSPGYHPDLVKTRDNRLNRHSAGTQLTGTSQ